MIKATMDISLGQAPDITPKFQKGSAIRFFDVPCGTITAIDGVEEAAAIAGAQEISFTKRVGDTTGEIGSSTDRVGFVIGQGETASQAVAACEAGLQRVKVIVK